MTEFLKFISDLRIVIAIAVIVVLLIIWLIIHKVKTKRFQDELGELKTRYDSLKGIPVSLKMNKAIAISNNDSIVPEKLNETQTNFSNIQNDMTRILEDITTASEHIDAGKTKAADELMDRIETEINITEGNLKNLESSLDEILAKETAQRQEVNNLKSKFRRLKTYALDSAGNFAFAWPIVEQKVSDTEKMFSTFEEWMYSNDFDKANAEMVHINENVSELEDMLRNLPDLIKDAKGIIPKMAEGLHKDYIKERKRGVYLNHLNVDENLKTMTATLKEDIKRMKSGMADGIKENLTDYKERISQLTDAVRLEGEAFDAVEKMKEETDSLFDATNRHLKYIDEAYEKNAERLGLTSMKLELDEMHTKVKELEDRYPEILSLLNENDVPATEKLDRIRSLNSDLTNENSAIREVRSQIEVITGDELRAKKELLKLQTVANTMEVKLRKFRLPNISEKYHDDMGVAKDYIYRLQNLMDEIPLNVQLLNSTLNEALDYIYKLYHEVNKVIATAQMVENTIVFGNRYRSSHADIDSQLTRSELLFRNGDYTQALATAISAIEKIYPGNYEAIIKENSASVA
ncbi:MAG: selenide, water dikinase [Solobacterium sp.]|nr:selenide, water dikinase [Solobacterium sp.]